MKEEAEEMILPTFKDDVIKLEKYQKKHPILFKSWVVLLLFWGYSYLFIILSILLICLSILVKMFLAGYVAGIILVPIILHAIYICIKGIIRMLTYKIGKPEGVEITPKDAPKLFETIKHYRKELRCSRIHKVLINNDDNAYVAQVPLLGVFGFTRNYLVIGMPIIMQLGQEHLEAVLAHEMGHISHLHSKFTVWIIRARDPWISFVEDISDKIEFGDFLLQGFYNWFIYRISASIFVLKRANEYVADKEAAKLTSGKMLAHSLALINIFSEHEQNGFWDDYYTKAVEHETVQPIYPLYQEFVSAGILPDKLSMKYNQMLNLLTEYYDSHPCYLDRITAIGEKPSIPELPLTSAAVYYFDSNLTDVLNKCDALFAKDTQRNWKYKHQRFKKRKLRFEELNAIKESRELSCDEAFEYAQCTRAIYGRDKSYEEYLSILERDPYHPDANHMVGVYQLLDGDSNGIEKIKFAINKKIKYFQEGYNLIYTYLVKCGMYEEAKEYKESQENNSNRYYNYDMYYNGITNSYDKLSIDIKIKEMINAILSDAKYIKSGYLTLKTNYYADCLDTYLLIVKPRIIHNKKNLEDLYDQIYFNVEDQGAHILIYQTNQLHPQFIKSIKRIYGIKVK